METLFLKNEDIFKFYDRIALEYELYVPTEAQSPFKVKCDHGFSLPLQEYLIKKYSELEKDSVTFNEYRAIEPIRAFFAHFKEEICEYFHDTGEKRPVAKPLAIAGIKNCDLFSLQIQDFVFLGGIEEDPAYKERREAALIISSDCPSFKETCFCRAFEINPYCAQGFDFNFSPLGNGYLVDIASIKAKKIADSFKDILTEATFGQISGRSVKRENVVIRMEEHLAPHKIPKKETLQEIVKNGFNSGIWQEQMKTCVECGGCIFMCDTCHCFLLSDEPQADNHKRVRTWDGCLLKNFTRVAGGANPLRMRYMRLRNRYIKKFDFFPDNIGYQACCGCGRCIDVCPGKIDIRYILRKLHEEKYLPAS